MTVREVRDRSPRPKNADSRVRVVGVVTHVNPHTHDLWIQDATAGIYIQPHIDAPALRTGELVEIDGISSADAIAPSISPRSIKRLGMRSLPEPRLFEFTPSESLELEAQWVEAMVVVRGARAEAGTTRIAVLTPEGNGTLVLPGEEHALAAAELQDASLIVRGVCVPTVGDRRVVGPPLVYISALPTVARNDVDLFEGKALRCRAIEQLRRFLPAPHPGRRQVKITGIATAAPIPGLVVVQDATGAAKVWAEDPANSIPLGARVEATGVLRADDQGLSLTRAAVRVVGPGDFPRPVAAQLHELAKGEYEAEFVKLSGRIESVRTLRDWTAVTIREGAYHFEAYIPGDQTAAEPSKFTGGTKVEVRGVPLFTAPDGSARTMPGLYLRDVDGITVLAPPYSVNGSTASWWTAARVAYLIGGFLALAIVVGAWAWTLRVRVRQAARQIEHHYEEKAKLEQQLRHAAKLEAVGRLAGGIAHDFNNLLTVINGCAELLAEEPPNNTQRIAELTDDIRRAGDRAAALTGQLLTFSRKRDIQITPVDLNEVVADTSRLLNRVIGEHIRIETALSPDLPPVRAEPGLLHQLIMNLAVNARDAMPHGGTLTLGTRYILDTGEPYTNSEGPYGSAPRKYVRLTVSDTGTGMTAEVKARVFEPFFTTKEVNKGTGLGLATVYGVVQSLSGKISVESEVGRGTTFEIDLRIHGDPISDAELVLPTTPLPEARLSLRGRLAKTTILVVEDNSMVRDLLVTSLRAEGATVHAAARPEVALQVLAETNGEIDVMVTDVVMPGMSGRELADRVRLQRPNVRILFMSGYTADEVLRQGVLEDQVEFIQKPFTPDHLTARVLRMLGRVPA
ncbi:MAG TPA: response regulator [Gemmata sp.]|nr:response regulator [Gemmata sp.]